MAYLHEFTNEASPIHYTIDMFSNGLCKCANGLFCFWNFNVCLTIKTQGTSLTACIQYFFLNNALTMNLILNKIHINHYCVVNKLNLNSFKKYLNN